MNKCIWQYREGKNNSHYALLGCRKSFNYLSKIKHCEPYKGVADFYNGVECPNCKKPVEMRYDNYDFGSSNQVSHT